MFPRISYFVPEEWAQLAGTVALTGSGLLQGKLISLNAERPIRCILLSRLGYLLLRIKSPKQLSVTIKV